MTGVAAEYPVTRLPLFLAPLSIPIICVLLYLNSLGNDFHYDDHHSIVDNHHIRSPSQIPRFFIDPGTFSRDPSVGMYRPVLLVTYALNYQLNRYEAWGYRLGNILIHAAVALLVYLSMRRLAGAGNALAWAAGVGFATHPIHTQAVNYISVRSEMLSAACVLAAFYLVRLGERPKPELAAAAFAAGLLTKSTALALLPLLALYELTQAPERRAWKQHLPFWGLAAFYLLVITLNDFLTTSLVGLVKPLDHQIYTQTKALVYYLFLYAMPARLSIEHGLPTSTSLADGAVILSALLVAGLVWLSVSRRGIAPGSGLAFMWFAAGLGLTLVMPLNVAVSEHRIYLSAVGPLVAVGACLRRPIRPSLRWVGGAALVVFAACTVQRNQVWASPLSLWQDAAERADTGRVQELLGEAYYNEGDLSRAEERFRLALEREPDNAAAWLNLGIVRDELGDFREAEAAYIKALGVRPDLAEALKNLGRLHLKNGRHAEAEDALTISLSLDSMYVQTHANLGYLYALTGRWSEAERRLRTALRLDPENFSARLNLANSFLNRYRESVGDSDKSGKAVEHLAVAERHYQIALAQRPTATEALVNLAAVYEAQGTPEAAALYFEGALEHAPDNPELLYEFGRYQARERRYRQALELLERAAQLGHTRVYGDIGNWLFTLGEYEAAADAFRRASQVDSADVVNMYNFAEVLVVLGSNWLRNNAVDKAVEAWREAREQYLRIAVLRPRFRNVDRRLRELEQKLP